jgi:hypothetical protein
LGGQERSEFLDTDPIPFSEAILGSEDNPLFLKELGRDIDRSLGFEGKNDRIARPKFPRKIGL